MHIYIDADACPQEAKRAIFRISDRLKVPVTLVANCYVSTPPSDRINAIQVAAGPDVADERIVELCQAGDLVITADIPLASHVVDKKAFALDSRGKLFTDANVKDRLATRDIMAELRETGIQTGGPAPYSQRDAQNFTNALDRFITKALKK